MKKIKDKIKSLLINNNKFIIIVIVIFLLGIVSLFIVINHNNSKKDNKNKNITSTQEEKKSNDEIKDDSTSSNENNDIEENDTTSKNKTNTTKASTNNTSSTKNNSNSTKKSSSSTNSNKTNSNKTNSKVTVAATKEYYCSSPFTLNGTKCVYDDVQPAPYNYYCDNGTLSGSNCLTSTTVKTSTYSSVAKEQCASLSGSGRYEQCLCNKSGYSYTSQGCYKNTNVTKSANKKYYCTGSYTLSGTNCILHKETDALFNLTCPSGYTLNGTLCEK